MTTLREAIDAHADARPDAPFIFAPEPDTTLSYAGLRTAARALCHTLEPRDLAPGDVVSWMLPNGISAATVFLGAMYGGYVASPISLLAQDAQIEHVLAHSGTRIVFAAPEFVERLRAIVARIGARAAIVSTAPDDPGFASADSRLPVRSPDDASPAMLMYTSGTTGVPKGALLSHGNMAHAGCAVTESLALTPEDRVLSSLPLYHVNGQCIATVSPLLSGGSIVMPHRFSASQWWAQVEAHRPTWLNLVPTIRTLLPISAEDIAKKGEEKPQEDLTDYLYEPSPAGVLDTILPQYVHFQVYQMLLDSRASEQSSRMVAMKNATDNAKQLIKDLTLEYNKIRQAAITTQLLEITTAQMAIG